MVLRRITGLVYLIGLGTAISAYGVFWLWYLLIFCILQLPAAGYLHYNGYSLVVLAAFLFDYFRNQATLRSAILSAQQSWQLGIAARQTGTAFVFLLTFLVVVKDIAISRLFLVSFCGVLFSALLLVNRYLPRLLSKFMFKRSATFRVLLVAVSQIQPHLVRWIKKRSNYGFQIAGVVADTDKSHLEGYEVAGKIADLTTLISLKACNLVMLSGVPSDSRMIRTYQRICDEHGVRLVVAFAFEQSSRRPVNIWQEGGMEMMSLRGEPLECPSNLFIKRILDVSLALVAVIFLIPPLALAVWLAQRRQSPGPLFFLQERTGVYGSTFSVWKFRTMDVDNPDPARQATKADPRIYPMGRWLRRTSLDELPQFFNVLIGQMSVVGPRPHLAIHDSRFAKIHHGYRVRALVKPGITGLAQVRGFRGEAIEESDVIKRTRSDLFYLENWSLWMDLGIIFRTLLQIIRAPETAK